MATTNKLQKLINTKVAIKDAINQKGGNITETDTFASYPSYILALNVGGSSSGGTSDGDPQNFIDIGYTFFPHYIQEDIEYSKSYQSEYNERNDNVLKKDENLIYFPMIEINEDSDITFQYNPTYPIIKDFPKLQVFPNIDLKGKDVGNWFQTNNVISTVYLNNCVLTSTNQLFSGCTNLRFLSLKNIVFSNNYFNFFISECTNLKRIIFDNIEFTSNVTTLSKIFSGGTSLINISLNNINTSNITDMSNMFYNCKSLTKLDLSNIDISKVTNMKQMFYLCSSLQNIKLNNFGCKKTVDVTDVFRSATNLGLDENGETINRQSLVDTLLTNSFDRATAGYSALTVSLPKNVLNRLTDEEKAQITAKGFTLAQGS